MFPSRPMTFLIGALLLWVTPTFAGAATYLMIPNQGNEVYLDCPESPEGKTVDWINSTCVPVNPSEIRDGQVETIDIGRTRPGEKIELSTTPDDRDNSPSE